MNTTHTPGPWAIGTTIAGGCDILAGRIGERIVVARVSDNSLLPLRECVDNANLIAAAPHLLAALEELLAFADKGVIGGGLVDDARAAIHRARGEG